jgi:hypothetical protein
MQKDDPLMRSEKKDPDRVGTIRLINNTTINDGAIVDKMELYRGQLFTMQRLLKTETQLLQSGLFANPPKITITYESTDGDFKNITVKIEE